MPSDSSFMSFRMDRRNTHMPDCESRTQRKNSIDMASESTRLPNLLLEAHGAPVAHRKARGVQEIDVQVQESLDQVGERVHRVAVVAVQRDDQVAGGRGESALVAAAIAAHLFADHFGAQRGRHFARCGRWSCCPPR